MKQNLKDEVNAQSPVFIVSFFFFSALTEFCPLATLLGDSSAFYHQQ
jgi:hypothetical protein